MTRAEDIEKNIEQINLKSTPEMRSRILSAASQAMEKTINASADQPSVWRQFMQSKTAKLTTVTTVILIVFLSIILAPTQSGYAQVVLSLRNTRTLAYTLITTTNSNTGETVKTDWLFKDPGLLRTTTTDGYITILNHLQGKQLSLVPPMKQYITAEFDATAQNGASDEFTVIERLRQLPEKADEKLEDSRINGIDVEGYRVLGQDVITTIWINSENKELVQVEYKYPSSPGMNSVMNNISFNVELEDSLFDLTPPDGYTPFKTFQTESQISEQNLVDFLKLWGQASTNNIYLPISIGPQFSKQVVDMVTEGKLNPETMSKVDPEVMYNGLVFIANLPASSNWRYAGENVKVGDARSPIFWYQPENSDTYRVIFGDLHIEDLRSEYLPK